MTKHPTPTEMSKGQTDNTKKRHKKFDYTAIADRLRTVSWSNYSQPTGVKISKLMSKWRKTEKCQEIVQQAINM